MEPVVSTSNLEWTYPTAKRCKHASQCPNALVLSSGDSHLGHGVGGRRPRACPTTRMHLVSAPSPKTTFLFRKMFNAVQLTRSSQFYSSSSVLDKTRFLSGAPSISCLPCAGLRCCVVLHALTLTADRLRRATCAERTDLENGAKNLYCRIEYRI